MSQAKAPVPSQIIPDGENIPETTSKFLPAELENKWKRAVTSAEDDFKSLQKSDWAKSELTYVWIAFQRNEDLQKCTEESIRTSIVNLANTNFTLNPHLKLCALVPRKNEKGEYECFFEITYIGLIKILKDYNIVVYMDSFITYLDESFEYNISTNSIKHVPKFAKTVEEQRKREITGCYTRVELKSGSIVYHYVPIWEIENIRKHADDNSAWTNFLEDMIKKTVIRRHFKLLISGVIPQEIQNAIRFEDEANKYNYDKPKRKGGFTDIFNR